MSANFAFVGELKANTKPEDKMYFLKTGRTKGKTPMPYQSLLLSVASEKNMRASVELFGMKQDLIKTMDTDNNKIDIDWDNRFDDDVIKEVANYKKTIIKIGDERKEFVSPYDAVDYVAEHIDELNGKKVVVTGQRSKNLYQNKLSDRFQISSIRTIDDDDDQPNRLTVNIDFFFDKDSFDLADWKNEHKLYINGYTSEYISDTKETKYVPQQIVFDCGKIDWKNEKHRSLVAFKLKVLGCELGDEDKVSVKLKGKNVFKIGIKATYVNGSEKAEFDESMLTDMQKEAIELGLNTLDDFRPSGSIYGQRVVLYKLRDFNMRKDSAYENGMVDTEISISEFEEDVWFAPEEESVDDIEKDAEDVVSDAQSDEDDDDLFG